MEYMTFIQQLVRYTLFVLVGAGMFLFFIHPLYAQVEDVGSNIIVESMPDSSLSHTLLEKVKHSWPWYTTRASGLLAGILMIILILTGVGFITGGSYLFLEPITAWATHRALGIALAVSIVVHVGALYFDEFVHFNITSLIVPFVSDYKPVVVFGVTIGSLYVALGVLALYIFMAVVLTSLIWINKKPHTWKVIHVLSYIGMVFVFFHALFLGTDLAGGTPQLLWILSFVVVTYAVLKRLYRIKTT